MNLASGPVSLFESGGPTVVWIVVLSFVFLECAFVVGLFLPGDSMLITAGIAFAELTLGDSHIWALSIGAMIAAIAGNQVGYMIGRRSGKHLHARQGGRYFTAENLQRVGKLLERHGFWSVLVARWIPWVRTLCPLVAGAAGMEHRRYTVASTIGAIVWAPVLLQLGYYAGTWLESYPWIRKSIVVGMIAMLVVGTALGIRHYLQEMRRPEVDLDIR